MKRVLFVVPVASAAWAHMISMSSGDVVVNGSRAHYELRMPSYEVAHVHDPERTLLEQVRFASNGQAGKLVKKSCREIAAEGSYTCSADYEFPGPVDRLDVECTLHSVTVPSHVHLLRATKDGKHDQSLLDISFSKATLRFDPPSAAEIAARQTGAGFVRALGGLVQILFLASLVLAARNRRDLLQLTGMFLAGQVASVLIVPMTGWQPAARFVEAAAALTVAYLAVEILLLPEAGMRWLVVGVLGTFHGLYFEIFIESAGYRAGYVLAGAAIAEITAIALLAPVFSRIARYARALRPVAVSASVLLVFGMVWFFLRLQS